MTTPFSQLPLNNALLENLSYLGFTEMTAIQAASLPEILNNKDVIGQAKTGSGKTAAFGLGVLSKIDVLNKDMQAVILCPTRELSEQVSKELRKLARLIPNVKIATLCGGSPMHVQTTALLHGVHCVVGTPGRVLDHMRRNSLNLDDVVMLVLDEADRMLEMGFMNEISAIISEIPKTRQTLLFSATMPENIVELSKRYQKNAIFVQADVDHHPVAVDQLFFEKHGDDDLFLLTAILGHYQPESTLIFCNTKQQCADIAIALQSQGFYATALHGDLEQRERDEALVLFSNKSLSVLVATDVAARGLDIKDLQAVINFDLARDPEVHVHRVGRTGRAGKQGLAISFFAEFEKSRVRAIEQFQNKNIVLGSRDNLQPGNANMVPPMATLRISCGRKNKLRAGDILGALTAEKTLTGDEVGKIDIGDTHSFVAVPLLKVDLALQVLTEKTIKGRFLKVQHLMIGTPKK